MSNQKEIGINENDNKNIVVNKVVDDIFFKYSLENNILVNIPFYLLGMSFVKSFLERANKEKEIVLILVETYKEIDLLENKLSEYEECFEINTLTIISTRAIEKKYSYVLKLGNCDELSDINNEKFLMQLGSDKIIGFNEHYRDNNSSFAWRGQVVFVLDYSYQQDIARLIDINRINFIKGDFLDESDLTTQVLSCLNIITNNDLNSSINLMIIEERKLLNLKGTIEKLQKESSEMFEYIEVLFSIDNYSSFSVIRGNTKKLLVMSLEKATEGYGVEFCNRLFNLAQILDKKQLIKLFYSGLSITDEKHNYIIYDFSKKMIFDLKKDNIMPVVLENNEALIKEEQLLKIYMRDSCPKYTNDSIENKDLIGVRHDAKILKYLFSNYTTGSVAVGIIGEWGSGKSFFINQLYNEIKEFPENNEFLQVKFNAWHYSDTNVVLSLGNEIFNKVKQSISSTDDVTSICNEYIESIDEEVKSLKCELENIDKKIESAKNNVESAKEDLFVYSYNEVTRGISQDDRFLLSGILDNSHNIADYLESLKSGNWFKRISKKVKLLFKISKKTFILLPILIILLIFIHIGMNTSNKFFSEIKQYIKFTNISSILFVIYKATQSVEKILQKLCKYEYLQSEKLREISSLDDIINEKMYLEKKLIQKQVDKDSAKNLDYLSYLVNEKVSQRKYEEHLSFIHNLRHDMALLNDYFKNHDSENRKLILYVDDLDRCPSKQVVQVLEAIHLLMSFDSFIVVVAADMKWISRCLYQEHGNSDVQSDKKDYAYEYMEKIFQLYIKPRIIKTDEISLFVDGLMQNETIVQQKYNYNDKLANEGSIEKNRSEVQNSSKENERVANPQNSQVGNEVLYDMELKEDDKSNIKQALENEDITPRKIKRFINIYQIIKASYHLNGDSKVVISLLTLKMFHKEDFDKLLNANEFLKSIEDESLYKFQFLLDKDKKIISAWAEIIERYTF